MSLDLYDKKCVIGKGSYGEVWLVRHKKDKKQYVLKKMELQNASKRERKAAEQEGKLLSKLKHPNIVSYKDSFECENGFLYIAMGYCEGGDLYTRLKEQKGVPLEERQVVEWFVQITMALQYMHERNILHRDLKTQNIFLTKSKIIKVGDLGIARVLDSSSDMATTLIGTPYYMSPELFSNKPYNYKSDVWALGCCVYEMTTLKHAFNAKDMNSLVYKILRGKMPAMPRTYSAELVTLIKAMLNHNPDRRPSVNRILRDPYIKRNIAIFLEGTKKSRRPSSSRGRPNSGELSSRRSSQSSDISDVPDSARSSASSVSGVSKAYDKASAAPEEKLEPLSVGPDLHPIQEEPTPRESLAGSGESHRSAPPSGAGDADRPLPVKVVKDLSPAVQPIESNNRKKKRKFLSEAAARPIVLNLQRLSPTPAQNSSNSQGKTPDKNEADFIEAKPNAKESSSSPVRSCDQKRDHSKSPNRRKTPDGVRPTSSRSRSPVIIRSSSSPSLPSESANSRSRNSKRSSEAKQPLVRVVTPKGQQQSRPLQPRPLPPRPSSCSALPSSAASQQKLLSNERESGYGSSSVTDSCSQDPKVNDSSDTPRGLNLSARARRRERKESETPRTSRSVDIDRNRRSVDQKPTPSGEDTPDGMKVPIRASADAVLSRHSPQRSQHSPVTRSEKPQTKKQPSIGDSSSTSEEENESDEMRKNREKKRKEKEMNSFINLLDTTLRMNKAEEKSDSDDDDVIIPDNNSKKEFEEPEEKSIRVPVEEDEMDGKPHHPPQPAPLPPAVVTAAAMGKTSLTTTGRLWERITHLRKDCIRGLGVKRLKEAYDILDNFEADDLEPRLIAVLGKKDFDLYAGKVWQLKFCEEAAFGLM